jgi:Fe-S oxidoreductase
VHPSAKELRWFVEDRLDKSSAERVREHIGECEFCREFCDSYRLFVDSVSTAAGEAIPTKAIQLADRLYKDALAGKIISLEPLLSEVSAPPFRLAADGEEEFVPHVQNLTTLCSENPEIILRVMRDLDKGQDYLQLISDDPALSTRVMVQIPELKWEFITDDNGQATLESSLPDTPEKLSWQIKMPEAVFSLEPLVYDPDKTEYTEDIILETERKDKIKVTFEGKTEGKQIMIRILELDGRTDFDRVKVSISQHNVSMFKDVRRNELLFFDLIDANNEINIRLFQ